VGAGIKNPAKNSKFGMLDVVIDRFNEDDRIFLLDSDYYSIGHLPGRMFSVSDVAPTGDATKFVVLSEWTLIMKAPKASAWVADLNGS
jgi:hypothetical protein